jgi:hypothetical protein
LLKEELPGQDSNLDKENQKGKEQAPNILPENTYGESADGVAPGVAQLSSDPDLARVVEVWPELPDAIRRAVLALVQSVSG